MVSVCLIKLCGHLFCRLPILELQWTCSTVALIHALWRAISFCFFALLLAPAGSPQFICWKNSEQLTCVHAFHSPSLIKAYTCQSLLSCRLKILTYMNIPTHLLIPSKEILPCFLSSLHSSHCLFIQVFYVLFRQRNRLVLKFNSSIKAQCADEGKWKKSRLSEVKDPSSPVCLSHPAAV